MKLKKLISLKRLNPGGSPDFEVHLGEISQTKNLVLSTKDEQLAKNITKGYNDRIKKLNNAFINSNENNT